MAKPKKISQTQIARELGVSQALVSLVLNGRTAGVNAETYQRIWDHALKRGYQPKGMHLAASPAAGRPREVGFILRNDLRLHAPSVYFTRVHHGLHSALKAQGFTSVFLGYEDDLSDERLARLFHAGHPFQGVALLGEVSRVFLERLRQVERRLVAISARCPGLCHSVLGNEPLALEMLVRHLYDQGHRRFGWMGGNLGLGRHEARLKALEAALESVGLKLAPRYTIKLEQGDRAEGVEAAHLALVHRERRDFPTAFICYNSLMAAGALRGFQRAGLASPEAVSVAGADLSRIATEGKPRITAAGTSPEKLGEAAARLILASTGAVDESFTDLMLPAQLHLGETTGPAPA
jgi:LacI family transcriptional regulator